MKIYQKTSKKKLWQGRLKCSPYQIINTVAIFFLTLFSINAFAWGCKGHKLVAEIAFKVMDVQVQSNVLKALHGFTIEQAATWMDEQRKNTAFDEMKPWHFIEFNLDKSPSMAKQPNVVTEITKAIGKLKNKNAISAFEVQQNLLYIFHLIGDVSQPLHCGLKDDYGGNAEKVSCFGLKRPTSLHDVWDDEIIQNDKIGLKSCLGVLATLNKNDMGEIVVDDPLAWALDTRKLLPFVYDFDSDNITQVYLIKKETLVEYQLVKAGLRLAAVLTMCLKN